jgi:hypothetical protein
VIGVCFGVLGLSAVSWARFALNGTLRLEGVSEPLWIWIAFGGFAALAGISFWRVMQKGGGSLRLALLLQLCAAPALPLTSSDVFCNLGYGRVAEKGLSPYLVAPSELAADDPYRTHIYEKWAVYPTPYGPVVALFDLVAAEAKSFPLALALFKLLMLLATCLSIRVAWSLTRDHAFELFACNPLVAWELSGQAHNDAILVLGFCGFLYGAARNHWQLAAGSLALSLCTKPAAVPFVGLAILWQLRKSRSRALMLALVSAGAAIALYFPFWAGPSTLSAILRELRADPEHLTHSLTAVLYSLFSVEIVYRALQIASMLLLLWLAFRACLRTLSLEETARGAAVFYMGYGLLAAPWFQPWYITWPLPLLLVARDTNLQKIAAVWSALALVQYAVPYHTASAVIVNGVPALMWGHHSARRKTGAPPGDAAGT